MPVYEVVQPFATAFLSFAYSQFPDITNGAQKKDLLISCSIEGDYYILLSNNALSVEKEQICHLSLREFDLEISEVYADTLIRYQFFSIATDSIGYTELMKTKAETTILFGEDIVGNENISTKQNIGMHVFPNPVRHGEKCVLSFKMPEDKLRNYQVSVYSMAGSLCQVIKQLTPETMLTNLEAGMYVIALSDKKNRLHQSIKLLVIK